MNFENAVRELVRRDCQLTLRQLGILFVCSDKPRTIKQLSGDLNSEQSLLVRSVDRLATAIDPPLVQRDKNPADSRSILVSLTYAGRNFLDEFKGV